MSDPTPLAPGNDAPAAARRRSAATAPNSGAKVTGQFEREAYAAATSRGYGNAMGRGFELAVTLAVMVGIGWLADRIFGTEPLLIIVFSVLGFAGIAAKLWIGYDLEMKQHEEGAIWNRKPGSAS
ncbi:MAG: AtpZ/AtpI family protein [Acidimicrobiales bacterium]|nr:AtpZ/AtpI family protein [Acidimicrobiales bacterium]HRW36629.1 AtpZ/AtpI family protein [Aquihabitans sp.]